MKYSIIVPVYNRPDEVRELLDSLTRQTVKDFEVLIIEDGSTERCDTIVDLYRSQLSLQYFFKPNAGPGPARNFGYSQAAGEYLIVFDSDCIIPSGYLEAVDKALATYGWDAWGGPDQAHTTFTPVQRAMGYTMASVWTTGGIRGGKKHVGWFQPRSFNMGISRKVYAQTQGFHFDRYAEDIEFSIRMKNAGYKVGLIPEAYVYHKRRTSFSQFYNQVSNFGKGRALVGRAHPGEVKITHWLPTIFVLGTLSIPLWALISPVLFYGALGGWLLYLSVIFLHALGQNKDLRVAFLAVPAALIQLSGYGLGFLREWMKPYIRK